MMTTRSAGCHKVFKLAILHILLLHRHVLLLACDPSPLRFRYSPLNKSSTALHNEVRHNNRVFLARGGSISSQSSLGARVLPSAVKRTNNNPTSSSNTAYYNEQINQQETKEIMNSFLTRDSRNSFIARVYAILAGQLGFTSLVILLFAHFPEISSWMRRPGFGAIVPGLSLLTSTIAWYVASVSPAARRSSPMKWQILTLFTLGEAICIGFISSVYKAKSVFSACLAAAIATTTISWYTANQKNPKYDLSQFGSMLSSFGLIFLVIGLIQLFQIIGILPAQFLPISDMVYSLFGATLFSGYMAYHTRYIIGGNSGKYQMSEKDYVYGAMTLYNDIINLFTYVLKIMGEEKDDH